MNWAAPGQRFFLSIAKIAEVDIVKYIFDKIIKTIWLMGMFSLVESL